jgi:hypothetical protein
MIFFDRELSFRGECLTIVLVNAVYHFAEIKPYHDRSRGNVAPS